MQTESIAIFDYKSNQYQLTLDIDLDSPKTAKLTLSIRVGKSYFRTRGNVHPGKSAPITVLSPASSFMMHDITHLPVPALTMLAKGTSSQLTELLA